MALKRTKKELTIFSINIVTLIAGMVCLSIAFGTDHWSEGELRDKSNSSNEKYHGSMHAGLFEGEVSRLLKILGFRKNELDMKKLTSNDGPLSRRFWAATIAFLSITLAVSLITAGMTILNIVTKPVETIFGSVGLVFWQGLCLLSCILALSFWAAFHHVDIKKKILNNLHPPWIVYKAHFGWSFWLILPFLFICLFNIILLLLIDIPFLSYLRKKRFEEKPTPSAIIY